MVCYGLAMRLGHDVDEVRSWPYEKIRGWVSFISIVDEEKT